MKNLNDKVRVQFCYGRGMAGEQIEYPVFHLSNRIVDAKEFFKHLSKNERSELKKTLDEIEKENLASAISFVI